MTTDLTELLAAAVEQFGNLPTWLQLVAGALLILGAVSALCDDDDQGAGGREGYDYVTGRQEHRYRCYICKDQGPVQWSHPGNWCH